LIHPRWLLWIAISILMNATTVACFSEKIAANGRKEIHPAIATNIYPDRSRNRKMTQQNCQQIRQAIETRNFLGWQGLSPECTDRELFPNISSDLTDRPVRMLGNDFSPAVFVITELTGYYRPMVSFRDRQSILFDGMNPELAGGFAPLHQDLGEPADRLDWYYGTLPISGGEWVYPSRGITVFLNTTADKALHIALYRSTTLSEYQSKLRPHLQKKQRPLR
jgi:hypothetical protein